MPRKDVPEFRSVVVIGTCGNIGEFSCEQGFSFAEVGSTGPNLDTIGYPDSVKLPSPKSVPTIK